MSFNFINNLKDFILFFDTINNINIITSNINIINDINKYKTKIIENLYNNKKTFIIMNDLKDININKENNIYYIYIFYNSSKQIKELFYNILNQEKKNIYDINVPLYILVFYNDKYYIKNIYDFTYNDIP